MRRIMEGDCPLIVAIWYKMIVTFLGLGQEARLHLSCFQWQRIFA